MCLLQNDYPYATMSTERRGHFMTTFQDLPITRELVNILNTLGYHTPTEIQIDSILSLASGQDVQILAPTGSGKTLAFGIPAVDRVSIHDRLPKVLVLTPTRELAIQVRGVLYQLARHKQCNVVSLYGKEALAIQTLQLQNRTQIVVGTPGRVLDHINQGTLDLSDLEMLVLDEADVLMNPDFQELVDDIESRLPNHVQKVTASATFEDVLSAPLDSIERFKTSDLKFLKEITEHRVIFFANTKQYVDEMFLKYGAMSDSAILHGDFDQKTRTETMQRMKRHEINWLFASDVVGRGIDILDVDYVVNLEIPFNAETYVHRTGRTGRNEAQGTVIDVVQATTKERYGTFVETLELEVFPISHHVIGAPKPSQQVENHSAVETLYIKAGKKQKVRAGDLVGAISNIETVDFKDIGVIHIYESTSTVEILNSKGSYVKSQLENTPIKGKIRTIDWALRKEDALI